MTYSSTSPSTGPGSPEVFGFYDDDTGSIQYLVADPETAKAALVDVVLGFDPESAATHSAGADAILSFASSEGFEIEWILDTHPHADHLMASSVLKDRIGKPNAIGEKVKEIAELWRDYYNMPDAFDPARDFDRLFADGDEFQIGNLPVRVMLTPGHTLGSITYVVGDDAAFVHDTFMQPDVGTSRADFPGGSAGKLYDSLQAILSLPDRTSGTITAAIFAKRPTGFRPWPNSAATTPISAAAWRRRSTSRPGKAGTRPWPCPTGCCTFCR